MFPQAARYLHGRRGFTLIELLIAITIFIILATLTVATFNLNAGSERITAASRQVQAMLEGARSRAFKIQRPVGVRFILDPNFPTEVNSMIYVSAADDGTGQAYQTGKLRFVDISPQVGGTPPVAAVQQLRDGRSITWKEMADIQMLRAGVRIRIPAGTGPWYTVSSENFLTLGNNTVMQLTEAPLDISSYGLLSQNFNTNSGKIYDYELDLGSVMVPLQGEDPVQLPPGTCIDLTSSKVPSQWYLNRWMASTNYNTGEWIATETSAGLRVYRADNTGESGTSAPNWNSATNNSDTVTDGTGATAITWRCYQTPQLDVVFTPQGPLLGAVAAEGVLHLTLAETRDTRVVFEDGTVGIKAWDTRDRNGDGEQPDHLGSFRVISIFSASGAVNVSPIDQTDVIINRTGASGADGVADNLFRFALEGASSK